MTTLEVRVNHPAFKGTDADWRDILKGLIKETELVKELVKTGAHCTSFAKLVRRLYPGPVCTKHVYQHFPLALRREGGR